VLRCNVHKESSPRLVADVELIPRQRRRIVQRDVHVPQLQLRP